MPLSSREMEDINEFLALLADIMKKGLMGGSIAMSFCRHLIQWIKDRVHPAYEY
jgi:hypothetical protein